MKKKEKDIELEPLATPKKNKVEIKEFSSTNTLQNVLLSQVKDKDE